MKYLPKNPADAFYGIKFQKKVSILSASIIYVLFFIVYLLNKYGISFLFKRILDGYYEIGTDMAVVFGFVAAAIICSNLVCSISDGEGKIRDMYCSLAYCLMPYIFIKPFVVIISYVLTNNEYFIISFTDGFINVAIAILVFIMIKEIQSYSVGKTIRVVFLTAFTMAILIVTLVIIFALINQVFDFVSSVMREVYFRAS